MGTTRQLAKPTQGRFTPLFTARAHQVCRAAGVQFAGYRGLIPGKFSATTESSGDTIATDSTRSVYRRAVV
ncbi:hypothetical protein [Nocardia sp. NPDC057227]|uniref:hypothetical protein n=1 Tax=Nocardia sp. NPDC057227 TaxID=3346056 RepID=UPI00363D8B07